MSTLLWLALGVLLALLSWILPALSVIGPLVVLGLALVSVLLPRDTTSVGAKVAIGFGGTFLAIFSPYVLPDPLSATGATYLLFGGGLLLVILGVVAVFRNRRRRKRLARIKAAEVVLS